MVLMTMISDVSIMASVVPMKAWMTVMSELSMMAFHDYDVCDVHDGHDDYDATDVFDGLGDLDVHDSQLLYPDLDGGTEFGSSEIQKGILDAQFYLDLPSENLYSPRKKARILC